MPQINLLLTLKINTIDISFFVCRKSTEERKMDDSFDIICTEKKESHAHSIPFKEKKNVHMTRV
jgi:hypothetical protein